jgi:hypothetical protein
VRLWDAATGQQLRTLAGHQVESVEYSLDGRRLAAAGKDGTIRLWDISADREAVTLRGHARTVWRVAYSPDGRTLASAGHDHTVRLWDVATGLPLRILHGHTALVLAVAWSPDGRMVASAGVDRAVRLWDPATGREAGTLLGPLAAVRGVAFSPDGRRIASANDDGTVRLWDPATEQELLTLRGHVGFAFGVVFSPDGRTLASSSFDRMVRLWDSKPMTPEVHVVRQARRVVESLFAESLPTAEVLARIRRDPLLSPEVRRGALELAEPYGNSLVVHEAERLVESLYAKGMLRPQVVASLSADASLGVAVRRQALALAECVPEDPGRLDGASRLVVNRPGGEAAAYRLALRQAEVACRLIPADGQFLTTLGLAQYRVGLYEEAVVTLSQAERLNTALRDVQSPADLACLALSRHRLGQTDQARAVLSRLRETMKGPQWARNGEALDWLHEAEVIELDLAFPADAFARGP